MMTRIAGVLVSLALLAGCAGQATAPNGNGFPLPVGTVLELKQALEVPGGHARVFLQYGKVVEKYRLNQYQPHCNFEQRAVSDGTAAIAAGRYTVAAVSDGEETVVQRRALIYAALRPVGDQMPEAVSRYYHFTLTAPEAGDVMRLTCHGGFEIPGIAQLPTLDEIRRALGKVVAVELP